MHRRSHVHDDGFTDDHEPFSSSVDEANDDISDTFSEPEEHESELLELRIFNSRKRVPPRRISMFGSSLHQNICDGDPEALTSSSGHETSSSSDTQPDVVSKHQSSPDPASGTMQLAISMQPWAAQVGLAGTARPVPSTKISRRPGSSARSPNRSESLSHDDRFLKQSNGGGPANGQRSNLVHQTSTGVQTAIPSMNSENLTGLAKQRSSKSPAAAAMFRPSTAAENAVQTRPRKHPWLRSTASAPQAQQNGSTSRFFLRTDQHVGTGNVMGNHRIQTSSAKRTSRDRRQHMPSRHRITPLSDDTDASASPGSSSSEDGVASEDPDQNDIPSDIYIGGIPSRSKKRRRLTMVQTPVQAESSRSGSLLNGHFSIPRRAPQDGQTGQRSTDNASTQTNQRIRRYGPAGTRYLLNNPTFSPFAAGANVIFLSHLFPRRYDPATRGRLLAIFRRFAPYVPLCIMEVPHRVPEIGEIGEDLLAARRTRPFTHPPGPSGRGWPSDNTPYPGHVRSLPVEIFEQIGGYLPRDSVQNMRLVNHEFERKVSCFAFRSVVVPFRPKIYGSTKAATEHSSQPSLDTKGKGKAEEDMPQQHTYQASKGKGKDKEILSYDEIHEPNQITTNANGKGKEKETFEDDEDSQPFRDSFKAIYNPKAMHVKDGMRIFEQWGPAIKKFALTFEVPEDSLKGLLPKKKSTMQQTFWGSFEWPKSHYSRYEDAAILEDKADETSAMTIAFSKLRGIQELGLSMISGLRWLNGPDVSDRVKLYKPKPVVFAPQYALPDKEYREADETWEMIVQHQTLSSQKIRQSSRRGFFTAEREYPMLTRGSYSTMPRMSLAAHGSRPDEILPPIMFNNMNMEARRLSELNTTRSDGDDDPFLMARTLIAARTGLIMEQLRGQAEDFSQSLIPNALTQEQKEWLMEMDWAQRAFLASWCIAVLDNSIIFHSLKRFTIGNISSGLLPSLQREDVWRALPNLQGLTVLVWPDWRQVTKDTSDEVDTPRIHPSLAQEQFHNFLSGLFARNRSIKNLKIGYVGGGEQGAGMFARNRYVVPAPIMRFANVQTSVDIEDNLYFPYIEHLTLVNCWMTPNAVTDFFANMQDSDLQTVTLDSVSLTAGGHPHTPAPSTSPYEAGSIAYRRNRWVHADPIPGCWSDVINKITPGHGIQRMRILYGREDVDEPEPRLQTSLRRITFNSCGYVRLAAVSHTFLDQSAVPHLIRGSPPTCLTQRSHTLERLMMHAPDDLLLGDIVQTLMDEEEGCLQAVWGMAMGWGKGRDKEKWDVREDGLGEGGLGRFRGRVKRDEKGAAGARGLAMRFNGGRRGWGKKRASAVEDA
ncbi:MAG: hypothetical protein Q9207_000895 [Kuettlingeria erythrocarpa]